MQISLNSTIAGYTVTERIGAGGYGEVWRADAPGGLTKAIKFVYGQLDEDRAAREMKALGRIREVRHPFLLSLERIEIVDGQLAIVTELADASLKERFEYYKTSGIPGIPRNELLQYMRDAADVLDYMSEEYSLQHLDIKPENMLLVGGRIKVADFGLVKDIRDVTGSMMGGLTPLYAPPEVFDGRPSRWSDQYSLAIVYQEMLTGELPFPGTTAVQLAKQHLHARPRVSALPEQDQAAVLRALEKDPRNRFRNCRQMVEALTNSDKVRSTSNLGETKSQPKSAVSAERTHARPESHDIQVPRILEKPQLESLGTLDLDPSQATFQPTVFIGAGASAGRALTFLRRRLFDRFGDLARIPALRMIQLDTDARELVDLTRGESGECLATEDILPIPLRQAKAYREDSPQLLQWMSRRWLYNIPRSLKTEGIRPLGRLAFVDHAPKIMDLLRNTIRSVSKPGAVATSRETTGVPFAPDRVRVILVTSVCGGTGSGMVLDLAYATQEILEELGLPVDNVTGILTHSTGRNPRQNELAVVNTYAFLSELNHFCAPGGSYPGDPTVGLEPSDRPAFKDAYLVHLGDDLTEDELHRSIDRMAEYLLIDTMSEANCFLNACRNATPNIQDVRVPDVKLRSFGIHQLSCSQQTIVQTAVEILCQGVVEKWLTGSIGELTTRGARLANASTRDETHSPDLGQKYDELAQQLIEHKKLKLEFIYEVFFKLVADELNCEPAAYFADQIQKLRDNAGDRCSLSDVMRLTETLFNDNEEEGLGVLAEVLQSRQNIFADRLSDETRKFIVEMIDRQDARVFGASHIANYLNQYFKRCEELARDKLRDSELQLQQVESSLLAIAEERNRRGRSKRSVERVYDQELLRYCDTRMKIAVLESVLAFVRKVKGKVTLTTEDVMDMARDVRHVANSFEKVDSLVDLVRERQDNATGIDALEQRVAEVLTEKLPELIQKLDDRIDGEIVAPAGGLGRLLSQSGDQRARLPDAFRATARSLLVAELRTLGVANELVGSEEDTSSMRDCLRAAAPPLMRCGGAHRLLVMVPEGGKHAINAIRQLGEDPTLTHNEDGDFVFCYELERLSLTQAAVTLIESRPDILECAQRLHTRTDVKWTSLPDLEVASESERN